MRNRWVVAFAAMLVMLGPGALYSYSLFTSGLVASFNWTTAEATWAFSLALFFLGVGGVIGGFWQDRAGPRIVALAGTLLWGAGNIIAGMFAADYGQLLLYLAYGVLGGLGCGMAYIACVSTVIKWFPERRGFGGGLVVMGFGLGAFVYGLVIRNLPAYQAAVKSSAAFAAARAAAAAQHAVFDPAKYALPPGMVHDLLNIFVVSGIAFAAVGGLLALLLADPPLDYTVPGAAETPSLTPGEMVANPQFYLLWVMLFMNVTAGLIIVSNAVAIIQELTAQPLGVVAGLYAFLAILNGLGRLLWGSLSDRIGRKLSFALIFGIQVGVFFFLGGYHDFTLTMVSFAIVLICFGGGFGVMPAFSADFFGTEWFGANYGLTLTAWGLAGILGPFFVSTVKDLTGSYAGAMQPVAIMLLVAMIFPLITDRTGQAEDEALSEATI